ncbi:peptidase M75 [bacterium]|nr:peptidase M75 [bacterium]
MMLNRFGLLLLLLLALGVAGCSDDDDPVAVAEAYDFTTILADYTDGVVIATYAAMKDACGDLATACAGLAAAPDQPGVDAAAAAWVAARAPWEASEAFLFGPAASMNLDPALDSWPVDRQQLDDVLASSFDLTPAFVAEGLGPALRGYHTVEYLLFRDGQPRPVGDFTARELAYVAAAAAVLADDATTLWAAWAEGIDGGSAYGDVFRGAGGPGSGYPTQAAAVQEMLEGMIAICDEVANGKIADPYDENDTSLVESQFSFNSLTDFANNLRSVRNAYLGEHHLAASDGEGLTDYVATADAALDLRLQAELDAAIAAIGAIPAPFRDNLAAAAQIEAAQAAIQTVMTTLAADVTPLVLR